MLSERSLPLAAGRVVCWSGERLPAYSRRGAELPGDACSYSALQPHPQGGGYAGLSPSASALAVAWELLHCLIASPALLWLMVGFIHIFLQQCCGVSELPPLQVGEAAPLSRGIRQVS